MYIYKDIVVFPYLTDVSTMCALAFLQYLKTEKRYSFHTIRAYESDLVQFSEYLKTEFEIFEIKDSTAVHIRSFAAGLIARKISPRSVNRKLTCLRSFFRYCLRQGDIDKNPMNKVISPRSAKRLPCFIEKEGMEKLFNEDLFDVNFLGYRDKAILEAFYGTGMRLSELRGVKTADIDLQERVLKVLGKRNKERIIPFGNAMTKSITEYLKIREESFENLEQTNYLFVNTKGTQLTAKNIYIIVRKYIDQITTIGKRSPHTLRHTFATHLLNEGAELNSIKEMLGHSSLASTQIYAHNTINRLRDIYKQAHPRA